MSTQITEASPPRPVGLVRPLSAKFPMSKSEGCDGPNDIKDQIKTPTGSFSRYSTDHEGLYRTPTPRLDPQVPPQGHQLARSSAAPDTISGSLNSKKRPVPVDAIQSDASRPLKSSEQAMWSRPSLVYRQPLISPSVAFHTSQPPQSRASPGIHRRAGPRPWVPPQGRERFNKTEVEFNAFAPGLSIRKPKASPYDKDGRFQLNPEYAMAAESEAPVVGGSWTLYDTKTNERTYDKSWHEEKEKRRATGVTTTVTNPIGGFRPGGSVVSSAPASRAQSVTSTEAILVDEDGFRIPSPDPPQIKLDPRFENPDLDIDEDVRRTFLPISAIGTQRTRASTVLEHRNPFMRPVVPSNSIKIIIGGEVINELVIAPDRRGEFQDRQGNYIGENLGQMKKHLVEDRKRAIEIRDQEMVEATKKKRAFEALSPEVKALELARRRAPLDYITAGEGAAPADMYEFTDVPERFLQVMARSILSRISRPALLLKDDQASARPGSAKTMSTVGRGSEKSTREYSFSNNSDFMPFEDLEGYGLSENNASRSTSADKTGLNSTGGVSKASSVSGNSRSTTKATKANTASIGTSRTSRGRKIFSSSSIDENGTPSFSDEDPELALVEDIQQIPGEFTPKFDNEGTAAIWHFLAVDIAMRGRVVSVTLHDPIEWTTGAITQRIFGGVIQEIQFHPKERIAVVVFLFPREAEALVRHVKSAKEKSGQEYRRLQIDAEWYRGSEHSAVYPKQANITTRIVGEQVSRVLGVNGIPLTKKKEEVNKELNQLLSMIIVSVGLNMPSKRYVRERDGKMAIVEFASVKDAVEAMRLFKADMIRGYEGRDVQWMRDPCDRSPAKQPWCSCENCCPQD